MEKYKATITEIGELAEELLQQGMMVLFNNTAPAELREISIIHSGGVLKSDLQVGDKLFIGKKMYTVTAIGKVANKNLKKIGHACLKFDAKTCPDLPGDVHLKGEKIPSVKLGDTIQISNSQN
ncbi:MAG: PTS glucitol/sorbitol transporter subunit IIA [Tepidanaerobacteraceae bacterium]|nr:PTS glucitol/sorbitol transporter subunit IIA [Thermoanaerobacterales bacterium]